MHIQVKLLGSFAKYAKNLDAGKIVIKDQGQLKDLIEELRLPAKSIRLIFINGKLAHRDEQLNDGDTVVFFPLVVGG